MCYNSGVKFNIESIIERRVKMNKEFIDTLQELKLNEVKKLFRIGKKDVIFYAPIIKEELSLIWVGTNQSSEYITDNSSKIKSIQALSVTDKYEFSYLDISNEGVELIEGFESIKMNLCRLLGDSMEIKVPYTTREASTYFAPGVVLPYYFYAQKLNMSAKPGSRAFIEKLVGTMFDGKYEELKSTYDENINSQVDMFKYTLEDIKKSNLKIDIIDDAAVFRFYQIKTAVDGSEVIGEVSRIIFNLTDNTSNTYARYSYNKWKIITKRSGVQINQNAHSVLDSHELKKLNGTRLSFINKLYDNKISESFDEKDMPRVLFNTLRHPLILSMLESGFEEDYTSLLYPRRDFMGTIVSIMPRIKKKLPFCKLNQNDLVKASRLSAKQFNRVKDEIGDVSMLGVIATQLDFFGKPSSVDENTFESLIALNKLYKPDFNEYSKHPLNGFIKDVSPYVSKERMLSLLNSVNQLISQSVEDLGNGIFKSVIETTKNIVVLSGMLDVDVEIDFASVESIEDIQEVLIQEFTEYALGLPDNEIELAFLNDLNREVRARGEALEDAHFSNRKYKERHEENQKYVFEDDNFKIVVPKQRLDLFAEGATLRHCVGSYHTSYVHEYSNILFIREKKDLDKPFFTVELSKSDTMVQCLGYGNKKPKKKDLELVEFLEDWTSAKNINGLNEEIID